jgi:hypothetical protein
MAYRRAKLAFVFDKRKFNFCFGVEPRILQMVLGLSRNAKAFFSEISFEVNLFNSTQSMREPVCIFNLKRITSVGNLILFY